MTEIPDDDCVMAAIEHEEEEPMLRREKESTPLLQDRSLNLWFLKASGAENKIDKRVISTTIAASAKTIETVDVGADLWNHMNDEEVNHVFQTIGYITNLKWLCFSLSCTSQAANQKRRCLSMKMLSHILSKAEKLEFFILYDVILTGSKSDWSELTDVLKSHGSLQHVSLEKVDFNDSKIDLDTFVLALSQTRTLELFEIVQNNRAGNEVSKVSPCALETFLSNARALRVLRLCGLGIGDEHIMRMSASLKENQTLKELCLWQTQLTEKGMAHFSNALSINKSLTVLNLNENNLSSQAGNALFSILHEQSQLESGNMEELYVECQNMDKTCRRSLLKVIESNRVIKKLEVCFGWSKGALIEEKVQFQRDLATALYSKTTIGRNPFQTLFDNQKHNAAPHRRWEIKMRRLGTDDAWLADGEVVDDQPME